MARTCNVCGERIRPGDKVCRHCGMRVEGSTATAKVAATSSRESLTREREALTRTIEQVARERKHTSSSSTQQHKTAKRKNSGCGCLVYMIIIIIGISVIAPIIMNFVVEEENVVAEEVVIESNKVEVKEITSAIYMLEDVALDSKQTPNRINTYSPNTKAFVVSGTIKGIEEGTPINLTFWDETEDWMLTSDEVIVYADEHGSFYYQLKSADVDYHIGGITYPGDYSVTVTIDNEDFSDYIPFSVYSDPEGKQLYSDLFNDIYMIEDVVEGESDIVYSYPAGSTVLKAELSYIHISAQTMVRAKWLTKKNDVWEEIIFDEDLTYYIAEEDGASFLHNFWIVEDGGWESGQYKIELYLEGDQLAAVREFTVGK